MSRDTYSYCCYIYCGICIACLAMMASICVANALSAKLFHSTGLINVDMAWCFKLT